MTSSSCPLTLVLKNAAASSRALIPVSCGWIGENSKVFCCGEYEATTVPARGPKPVSTGWEKRFSGSGETAWKEGRSAWGRSSTAGAGDAAAGPKRGVKLPGRFGWICCCSEVSWRPEGVVLCQAGRGPKEGAPGAW